MLMANVLTLLARAWAEKEFSQSSAQNKSAEEIEAEIARLTKQAERSIQTQIDHMNQQINTRKYAERASENSRGRLDGRENFLSLWCAFGQNVVLIDH